MLGVGAIIDNLLHFLCFLYLWGRRRTLAPTAYSHDSLAKQWPRYCEPQDQNRVDVLYKCPFMRLFSPHKSNRVTEESYVSQTSCDES